MPVSTDPVTIRFCQLLRARSRENHVVVERLAFDLDVAGALVGKLREELDSMVRAIYLLQIGDRAERRRLMDDTLNNRRWKVATVNGKMADVTDKDMVALANQLHGWALSVYRFGCAFIHLSSYHDRQAVDPFLSLDPTEQNDILSHLRYYHHGLHGVNVTFEDIAVLLPMVHLKIRDNLRCEIEALESERGLV